MRITYDLNTNGVLIICADAHECEAIEELADSETGGFDRNAEYEVLESLLANSELDWIDAEEISALTSAPIIGLRDADGEVTTTWSYADDAIRSFLTELVDKGSVVFHS